MRLSINKGPVLAGVQSFIPRLIVSTEEAASIGEPERVKVYGSVREGLTLVPDPEGLKVKRMHSSGGRGKGLDYTFTISPRRFGFNMYVGKMEPFPVECDTVTVGSRMALKIGPLPRYLWAKEEASVKEPVKEPAAVPAKEVAAEPSENEPGGELERWTAAPPNMNSIKRAIQLLEAQRLVSSLSAIQEQVGFDVIVDSNGRLRILL